MIRLQRTCLAASGAGLGGRRMLSSQAVALVDIALPSRTGESDAVWAAKVLDAGMVPSWTPKSTAVVAGSSASVSFPRIDSPSSIFPLAVFGTSNLDRSCRHASKRMGATLSRGGGQGVQPEHAFVQSPGGATFALMHRFRRAQLATLVLAVKDLDESVHFWEHCVGMPSVGDVGTLRANEAVLQRATDRVLAAGGDKRAQAEALAEAAGASEAGWVDPPGAAAPMPLPLEVMHAVGQHSDSIVSQSVAGRRFRVLCGGQPRTAASVMLLEAPDAFSDRPVDEPTSPAPWTAGEATVSVRVPFITECYGWIARRPEAEVDPDFDEEAVLAATASSLEEGRRGNAQGVDTTVPPLWATDLDGNYLRLVQAGR